MCGICGIVAFDKDFLITKNLISEMNDQIKHRGPDDSGYYIKGNVALAHRRLSIIDLGGGHQPLTNEDGSVWITFNGEIFNYQELRTELELKGHQFRTNSDTEAIVHAYEEYGEDCPTKLRGMFAFAIWDEHRCRLLIARDRLGKKPLYYYKNNQFLIFASEIKALLAHPEVKTDIDLTSLDRYLSLRYVPGPQTMLKNIFKLQPGHTLVYDEHGLHINCYWQLEFNHRAARPLIEEVTEFRDLLKDCVKMRLMSDVPLGVFLSGGIDSSSIVALMSELGVDKINTFSIGYQDDKESNELDYARIVARHFHTEHYELNLEPQTFGDFIPELVWYMDEPVADTAAIPLYFISKLSRQHVTVVLSGEGADELLAGYSIYQRMLTMEKIHKFYYLLAPIIQPITFGLPKSTKTRKYLLLASLPFELRYRGVANALSDELKHEIWPTSPIKDAQQINRLFAEYYQLVRNEDRLNQMLFLDTKVWLPDDLLVKADKMTMANAQELRTPFLDHKLVEYAANAPVSLKLFNGTGKYLLKAAMANSLPQEIINRPKKGFPTPIKRWLTGKLGQQTRDILLQTNSATRRYFDIKRVEGLINEHIDGRVDRKEELFTLLIFEYWHRRFLGS